MPKDKIISFIDFFYPPFRKLMPEQTFRYAACGGANTLLGLAVNFVFYTWVFQKEVLHLGFVSLEPYVASLAIGSLVNIITGFLLMKYVVFVDSNLKGRIQLFRYVLSFASMLLLNYVLLKLFVKVFHWEAFFSQCLITVIVITVSYLSQKYFTFRTKKEDIDYTN
ncbi:GtrA family protein [Ferruginibacter sp.]